MDDVNSDMDFDIAIKMDDANSDMDLDFAI